ncbi:MAG: Protein yciF [Oceanicaulis sp. HLUCCA04]|nr:MAG: Protein yciF [Oceanicaulis sp. HLUCCA04]
MDNLKDIYLDQLQDLWSANQQARGIVRELAGAAASDTLRRALERGVEGIEDGRESLKSLIEKHGKDPRGEHCKGMEGLVKEARAHALKEDFSAGAVRDAVIITQYQRMAHYAIAGYGCARSFARQLGLDDDAQQLNAMLDAAYSGDKTMTEIAGQKVNERAA